MVKNFKGMRIGQVGTRPAPFFSVIWNEGELMEKFGIKIIPINFAIIEQRMRTAETDYADEIAEYEQYFLTNYELDDLTPKYIKPMATMTAMYKHLFEEFNLDVLSAECWTATPVMFDGLAPCALYGLLNEMGLMVSCESDITDMRSAYCSLDIQSSSPERRQTKDCGEPNLYEVTAELCRGE